MSSKILNVGLIGAGGKMGKTIISLIEQYSDLHLAAAFEHLQFKDIGKPVNIQPNPEIIYKSIVNLEQELSKIHIDVFIDFSHPDCTTEWVPIILSKKIPIVIATTGLTDSFRKEVETLTKRFKISALMSSNMAFGMNLFIKIAKDIATYIPNWDIEIIEAHHHHKIDTPSGTALTIANELKQSITKESDEIFTFGRGKGRFPRQIGNKEIGIHAIRAGDIIGEHTVIFAGSGERLEFTHRAHSRVCFGEGALNAARFLVKNKNTGILYHISDMLTNTGRQ